MELHGGDTLPPRVDHVLLFSGVPSLSLPKLLFTRLWYIHFDDDEVTYEEVRMIFRSRNFVSDYVHRDSVTLDLTDVNEIAILSFFNTLKTYKGTLSSEIFYLY